MKRYVVGITGASGSIYGVRLIEELLKDDCEVFLIVSENGKKVLEYENDFIFEKWLEELNKSIGKLVLCDINDMFSPIASGTFKTEGMVIAPCSMGTLSKISNGITDNLLIRVADVMIKEKRKLVLVPRETPLNSIHLRNMLELSNLNVTILPPMPAFYHKPKTLNELINITVGRMLTSLSVDNELNRQWSGENACVVV